MGGIIGNKIELARVWTQNIVKMCRTIVIIFDQGTDISLNFIDIFEHIEYKKPIFLYSI